MVVEIGTLFCVAATLLIVGGKVFVFGCSLGKNVFVSSFFFSAVLVGVFSETRVDDLTLAGEAFRGGGAPCLFSDFN